MKNDGGPAFPVSEDTAHFPGMSLRDWFAGQALAGLLADLELILDAEGYANRVYGIADAMLAERESDHD